MKINVYIKEMLYRSFWLCGLCVLIALCLIALWDVSFQTCGEQIPILLSRALTTDPYRGITLGFCLIAVASSIYLNSVLIIAGFVGIFSAFLVSMFQTDAHNALIFVSAMFIMYECYPKCNSLLWRAHWWLTVVAGIVCFAWIMYTVYGCNPIDYNDIGPLPESVRCARCSYWYISEYVLFWSMFGLVYWRIPPKLVWRDQIFKAKTQETPKDPEEINGLLF
jgi:hypothetical protein